MSFYYIISRLKPFEFESKLLKDELKKHTTFYEGIALKSSSADSSYNIISNALKNPSKESFFGEFNSTYNKIIRARDYIYLVFLKHDYKDYSCAIDEIVYAVSTSSTDSEKAECYYLSSILNLSMGYYYNYLKDPIEARKYYNKSINALKKCQNLIQNDFSKDKLNILLMYAKIQKSNARLNSLDPSDFQEDLYSALDIVRKGHFDISENICDELRFLTAACYFLLGYNLNKINNDKGEILFFIDRCIHYLSPLFKNSSFSEDSLIMAGFIYQEAYELKNAIKYYSRLVNQYQDSNYSDFAYFNLADCLFKKRRFIECITAYKKAVSLSKSEEYRIKCILALSQAHTELRNYQESLRYLSQIFISNDQALSKYKVIAKRLIWNNIKVMISPSVKRIPKGKSQVFNATLIYMDGKSLDIPDKIIKWHWEVIGNDGDGHKFLPSENTATYIGGFDDFSRVIMKAIPDINFSLLGNYLLGNQVNYIFDKSSLNYFKGKE